MHRARYGSTVGPTSGRRRNLVRALAALLLSGCAAVPQVPPERSYTGRFSAVATQGEKRDSVSGRFTLELRGERRSIDLATPLGTTVAHVEIGPEGAQASGPGLQDIRGADADALTERLLGWRLPVSGLADWIEGRPAPGRPARVERDGERPVVIEQDGWTVRLAQRFEDSARPRLIVIERPASPFGPGVVLRLIVDPPAT